MNYKKVKAKAKEIDKTLDARKDFRNKVFVHHSDGTKLELHYASLRTIDDGDQKWLMIFTEHNGIFVYHNEDLESCTVLIGDENFDALKESLEECLKHAKEQRNSDEMV